MNIRNIRFYDDSLQNILDVSKNENIDCRQVIPEKLIYPDPTFKIEQIKNSFIYNTPNEPKVWKKKNGQTAFNQWKDSGLKTNYDQYKEWLMLPEQGWMSEGMMDEQLRGFLRMIENKRFQNNLMNPIGIFSKNYSIQGPQNHPGRRSFSPYYKGLSIAEMLDIMNWSNYLKSQGLEGIVLFDFDGVINLSDGLLLFDITEEDLDRNGVSFEGYVKFFVGTKERFDLLKIMFSTLYQNQTYFFILTFMLRCHLNIYKRFLQILNPHFEHCKPFDTIPSHIQSGNIMCCTSPDNIKGAKMKFFGTYETRQMPTKLQFLEYFLGPDLNQWFQNSLFKPQLINPLNITDPTVLAGGKKKKSTKKKSVQKKKSTKK